MKFIINPKKGIQRESKEIKINKITKYRGENDMEKLKKSAKTRIKAKTLATVHTHTHTHTHTRGIY